jgi:uncharacterized repeat protein (TIGR03803 family)
VRLNLLKTACILFAVCIAATSGSFAQSSTGAKFTTLVRFDGTNGSYPDQALIQGVDGNLYGVAPGSQGLGYPSSAFFRITPAGTLTFWTLSDSAYMVPFLSALGTDGNFYGTTFSGGTYNQGSVFQMTPEGQLATLYTFCNESGCPSGPTGPVNGVIQASDGNFYGTTSPGQYWGTIFRISPGGVADTLYTFDNGTASGLYGSGPLIQGTDGNFFGIDPLGGALFEFDPEGVPTIVHHFCCADGGFLFEDVLLVPPLVLGPDGSFYGETQSGGVADPENCTWRDCGTIFVMTPQGRYRVIHSFCVQEHCPDGDYPIGGLTLGSDGNFYGTTLNGGAHNRGTIFRVTPNGVLTTLHSFDSFDGYGTSGLVQATNGIFYGVTEGNLIGEYLYCCGSIFSLSVGLPSFVKTVPTIGSVGASVIVLGNDLTSASSVTFNGIPAAFTVVSDTEITATVPDDATTGSVEVTTSNGTLKSNLPFQVGFASTSGFGGPGWSAAQN